MEVAFKLIFGWYGLEGLKSLTEAKYLHYLNKNICVVF
jgi:hypothetical protein